MDILKYISDNPDMNKMYQMLEWSFYLDTLTPAQLNYLCANPDAFEEWRLNIAEKIKQALREEIRTISSITPETWGRILSKETSPVNVPVPDLTIHIPYTVKGVQI